MNIEEDNKKDINESGENNGESSETNKQKKDVPSKFDKIRKFFDEIDYSGELSDMNFSPMTIIAVSCVIIAFCAVFIAFSQVSLLKGIKNIYAMQRYG